MQKLMVEIKVIRRTVKEKREAGKKTDAEKTIEKAELSNNETL